MAQYELMFDVDALDDATTEKVYADHDALVSSHQDGTTLTITAEGATAATAAKRVVAELDMLGVKVRRLTEDLVSRTDIAARCDATPQAVGQWIRGTRQRDTAFPPRLHRVAGGIWLWGEVNDWLRRVGRPYDEGIEYPCRRDYDEINGWLCERDVKQQLTSVSASLHYPQRKPVSLVGGSQFDYSVDIVASSRVVVRRDRR